MSELVYDPAALAPGEPVILLHVGQDPMNGATLASLTLDLTAPLDETHLKPERFTGFEHRAENVLRLARDRAAERGIRQILVVDPFGLLRLVERSRR